MKQSEIIFAVEESPEGGYEAHALGHSIYTQADSLPQLREQVRDAVSCHFEPEDKPAVIRLHFVHDEVISA
jgi:hypothetical protein